MKDDDVLDWLDFVSGKFASSREGWIYKRDTGDLEHIRYKSDSTGYNSFWSRIRRALSPKMHFKKTSFTTPGPLWSLAWIRVSMTKDDNLPDGVVNGGNIITHWEEDGEYIMLMGPTVGRIVLDFMRANRDHVLTGAILTEMKRLAQKSKEAP